MENILNKIRVQKQTTKGMSAKVKIVEIKAVNLLVAILRMFYLKIIKFKKRKRAKDS